MPEIYYAVFDKLIEWLKIDGIWLSNIYLFTVFYFLNVYKKVM